MEEEFRTYLLASAALAELVGDRVAWDELPPGDSLPAITLHLVSGGRQYAFKGRLQPRQPLIQIDCWGRTGDEAAALAERLVEALDQNTARFQGARIVTERGDWTRGDGPRPDGTRSIHHAGLDVRVWFKPA